MKKIISSVIILLTMLNVTGCNTNDQSNIDGEQETVNVVQEQPSEHIKPKITIKVDPRIELLSIVQYLANYKSKDAMINPGDMA